MSLQYRNLHEFNDTFKKQIGLSIAFHLLVLLAFNLKQYFFQGEPLDLSSAIRVDMVGLPDKIQQLPDTQIPSPKAEAQQTEKPVEETKPLSKAAEPKMAKSEAANKEVVSLEHKKTQSSALNRLKSLQKIEENLRAEAGKKKAIYNKPLAGNVVSQGNSLRGVQKLQFDSYLSTLDTHVKQYWELPKWMINHNLRARAQVTIDSSGNVISRRITESSQNQAYDSLVLQAIDHASPFPRPPERLVEALSSSGILLGFPD